MLSDRDRDTLAQLADNVTAAERALAAAIRDRDDGIRIALAENGAGATELTRIVGVNRARIYQIRDRA